MSNSMVYGEGQCAFDASLDRTSNPYGPPGQKHIDWERGWLAAKAEYEAEAAWVDEQGY